MTTTKDIKIKDWYIENFQLFEQQLNGQANTLLSKIRKDAIEKFKSMEFPTLKDEEWKYTNVKPVLSKNFTPLLGTGYNKIDRELLNKILYDKFDYHLIVFVNGNFSPELSDLTSVPGSVIIDSLNNLLVQKPEVIRKYLPKLINEGNAFDTLNSAYAHDGAVVIIPDNYILEKPVQILHLTGDADAEVLSTSKNLFIGGKNSQFTVLTSYNSLTSKSYFTNAATEIFAAEDAMLNFYKIQNEGDSAFHIEKTNIDQKGKSIVNHFSLSVGGSLVRNDINAELDGENIECHLYGLYIGNENQHIDNHTFIDHIKPNCMSNELYKGILDDDAHGVFAGKILVRQEAQKTNAFQSNKSVLLSKTAGADTKPQLEIYADDVKCSHGATVGSLDEQAYFYIRSRGIPSNLAKSMLIKAFAEDVVDAIQLEPLREKLSHQIFQHLHTAEF